MPGAFESARHFSFLGPPHVALSSRRLSNYSIVPTLGDPFLRGDIIKGSVGWHFGEDVGMKKLLGLIALLFIFTLPAAAQQTPAWDVDGAYLYRSFYPPNAPRFGMNGWNASLDHNLKNWIGISADFSGTYNNQGVNGKTQIYTFMAGPRIYPFGHRHKLTPYGQVLFGAGYDRLSFPLNSGFPATTFSSTAFAWTGGAGVQWKIKREWSIRLLEFDYEQTRFSNYPNQTNGTQGNYRISVGLVYHIGVK
jgi:opacity protein-like surface antigen